MALKDQLQDEMKAAMRAKDKARLGVIRLMLAALKQREIDEQISLDDSQVIATLDRMTKQRRESFTQYRDAGRNDLAEQESFELEVIQSFMPAPLSAAEIDQLISTAIATSGGQTIRDMGKVMAQLKPQLQGRADMAAVSAQVKARLNG